MLKIFFYTFFSMLAVCTALVCTTPYKPRLYINNPRVPTDCKLEMLSCPTSWKAGIPEGTSTDLPLIYNEFVTCHEGLTKCGYVPINSDDGEVLGTSGVTIGGGVDLGSKNGEYFTDISVEATVINQLEPYFGLTQNDAACAIIENPLALTLDEAKDLTTKVKDLIVESVQTTYNAERGSGLPEFASLPRGIRTAISDVWFQFGTPEAYPEYPKFWNLVIKNDWEGAINELENFYNNPEIQQRGDLKRRNNEADIIRAVLEVCTRSVDVVFLLDQSGSISSSDFSLALDFISRIINAFSDEDLADEDGTRFGLSLFGSFYTTVFYLSSYKSKEDYDNAIDNITKIGGGTQLGSALNLTQGDQFTELNGLRPDTLGLPKILIVLTDGKAGDSVEIPAMNVRDSNIIIYVVGIGGYDINQLNVIASPSPPPHIYILDSFTDLSDFASTLTATTCYESQPIPINSIIIGVVLQDEFQYYQFEVQDNMNLMIVVVDEIGLTFLYASRVTPHPYEYDNDLEISSSDTYKELVISPLSEDVNITRRDTENVTYSIYVSVKGASNANSFTLEGSPCDPAICIEGTFGTSDGSSLQVTMSVIFLAFVFSLFMI
ncbi:Collagen alpha-6(VI) chain-like [Oopsacas minuta]|uniref:Collagen alpha-6(VI) chain-like n=1 Tax=Oopsacas minuta TaxID=111878 RepID=A0AAV7JGT5_9METZ|nr:Collagen alpha-6(VI) chain-like [Oopsacas minuta]